MQKLMLNLVVLTSAITAFAVSARAETDTLDKFGLPIDTLINKYGVTATITQNQDFIIKLGQNGSFSSADWSTHSTKGTKSWSDCDVDPAGNPRGGCTPVVQNYGYDQYFCVLNLKANIPAAGEVIGAVDSSGNRRVFNQPKFQIFPGEQDLDIVVSDPVISIISCRNFSDHTDINTGHPSFLPSELKEALAAGGFTITYSGTPIVPQQ